MARLVAALIVVTLSGPSLVTLACNWLCAAEQHAAVTGTTPGCHGVPTESTTPTVSSAIVCHDVLQGPPLLSRSEVQPALSVAGTEPHARPLAAAHLPARHNAATRPPGPSRTSSPLRI